MSDDLFARLLHHRGQKLQPGDPVMPEISLGAPFHLPGEPSNAPYQYGRFHNPTWDALEEALALLEGAPVILFPSGMACIGAVLFSLARAGDRVLLPADGYYAARKLSEDYLGPLGVTIETRPTASFLDGGFDGYRLVLAETPSNPGLDVCDLRAVASAAKAAGAIVVVDNTTMTPLGQQPLALGADIVVSADTKAINGHSDTLMGHVATRDAALFARIADWRKYGGAIPGPFEAWLVYRGLETLEVRYERMAANAAVLAERLSTHRKVRAVRYPGLAGDPSHTIAKKQQQSFGFMLSLTLTDGAEAERFMSGCTMLQQSTSFGGVRTSAERRARWGDAVAPGYVRMSAGIEPIEPLWKAIAAALDAA